MTESDSVAEEEARYTRKHSQEERNTPCPTCPHWKKLTAVSGICSLTEYETSTAAHCRNIVNSLNPIKRV